MIYKLIYCYFCNQTLDIVLPQINGKYLAFCEGDDYWVDSLKLQKQYDYMTTHPNCSLVVHNTERIYMRSGRKKPFFQSHLMLPITLEKRLFCNYDRTVFDCL